MDEPKTAPDGTLPLVLSLVGLLLFQPLCIVSLVLGLRDKKACLALGATPSGSITAAIVLSIIGIVFLVVGLILFLAVVLIAVPEFIDGASS